jgi:hypothetical protein
VVGLVVVGAVAVGVVNSMSHKTIPGEDKFRCKKEIIAELRRQLRGMSAEQIAQLIGHDIKSTRLLLGEMEKDSMLVPHLSDRGQTVYRLKGI